MDTKAAQPIRVEDAELLSERDTHGNRRVGSELSRYLPSVVVVSVAAAMLSSVGVSLNDMIRYAAYWLIAVVLPGVLIFRLVFSARVYLVEDLAFGAVTGIAAEVLSVSVLRAVGAGHLAPWWWILPLAAFASVPSLRRHWWHRYHARTSPMWSFAMSVILVVVFAGVYLGALRTNPLPPSAGSVYLDMWWHLSIVEELLRPGPAQVPQVAGEIMHYHVGAHMHMSAASTVSGVSTDVVVLRLWILPVVSLSVLLLATVARAISGHQASGPIAVWLTYGALAGGFVWNDFGVVAGVPTIFRSPSQALAVPILLAGAWGLIELTRARFPAAGLAWLAAIALVGAMAKPTVVPILLCGTAAGLAFITVTHRRMPAVLLGALGGLLAIQAWSMLTITESGGSTVTLFGSLRTLQIYRVAVGDTSLTGVNSGVLLDSMSGPTAFVVALITLTWLLGTQAVRLVGLAVLLDRRVRADPASWWLSGGLIAGWFAYMLLDGVNSNQLYFMRSAAPLGAILTSWLVVEMVRRAERSAAVGALAGGAALGTVVALVVAGATTAASERDGFGVLDRALFPLAAVGVLTAAGITAWVLIRRRIRLPAVGGLVLVGALLGLAIPPAVDHWTGTLVRAAESSNAQPNPGDPGFLSVKEQEAAIWLRENTESEDIVATNSQCRPPSAERERCSATGFWISGLGGRRVLLEGWAFSAESRAAHGVEGYSLYYQPPPWPDRYDLSHLALESPTAEVIEELREEYGVRWLVGVRRAGVVSDELTQFATLTFDNGDVAVFELD